MMNFILPTDNYILAGVCHGIPLGKHSTKDNTVNEVMAKLVEYAEMHHTKLLKNRLATTTFYPLGSNNTV